MNFLKQVSHGHWNPALTLPNVDVWLRAANAYVELFADWPPYSDDYPARSTEAESIRRKGLEVQEALQAMVLSKELFAAAVQQYDQQVTATVAWLKSLEKTRPPDPPESAEIAMDWFADGQSLQKPNAYWAEHTRRSLSQMPQANGAIERYSVPEAALDVMARPPLIYAGVFGDSFRLAHELVITIGEWDEVVGREAQVDGRILSQVKRAGASQWETVESRRSREPQIIMLRRRQHAAQEAWEGVKTQFFRDAVVESRNDALVADAAARYDARLADLREVVYKDIVRRVMTDEQDPLSSTCDG